MSDNSAETGPYQPTTLLGGGETTQVWLADGPEKAVVLKLPKGLANRAGILREAKLLEEHAHPNLVGVIDHDPEGKWLALEHLDGLTVDEWSVGESPEAIVRVALQLLDVLEDLHERGVVHADVKPSNAMVDADGRCTLLDLGIAVVSDEERTGFKGTLGYAAPELLQGKQPTTASDLYGFGAVLYQALTGSMPFTAPDPAALTYLPLVSLPRPVGASLPEVPNALATLVHQLLSRRPHLRPQSVSVARKALLQALESKPSPPVLGMDGEREELRRAVVGASDGEPRVVVLYGPPGTGRRTLISEAVEYAKLEGMPYIKRADLNDAVKQLRSSDQPSVMVMRAQHKAARQVARMVLKEGLKLLLLLHADRPVPSLAKLGAIHITPTPLSKGDAIRLTRMWGADVDMAPIWWRETLGSPIGIRGKIHAWRRAKGLTESGARLPAESKRVLDAIMAHRGKADVVALASELGLGEHELLDHCEVLFAEDRLQSGEDGSTIELVRKKQVVA